MHRPDRDGDDIGDPVERVEMVELFGVDDRTRTPIRLVNLAIAFPAMVLVALVGFNLLPAGDGAEVSDPAVSPSTSPMTARSPSSSPATAAGPNPLFLSGQIDPGRYYIPWRSPIHWNAMRIHLTMPAGWWSANKGITRHPLDDPGPILSLGVHQVTRVVTDVCVAKRSFVEVGPNVEDLTTALTNQVGTERSGPTDATLGGYPATKFVLTIPGPCPGPERHLIWAPGEISAAGGIEPGLWLLDGGTATIYVVDVNGVPLVIASRDRGSSVEETAQLDAIIASIDIEPITEPAPIDIEAVPEPTPPPPFPPAGELAIGEFQATRFAFSVPTTGWFSNGPNASGSGERMVKVATGAEVAWVAFGDPDSVYADPCAHILGPPVGPWAADLAAAMATIPGTDVSETSDVLLNGGWDTAKHLVLTVHDDIECDPRDFFLWYDEIDGPRRATAPGSTIRLWIFNPNDRIRYGRVVIEAETFEGAGPDIEREIQQIVESITHGG